MKHNLTLAILTIIVLLTVIYGFIDGGSPRAAKDRKFDQTRYSNIQTIRYAIRSYYSKAGSLPATISDAKTDYSKDMILTDPETGKPYEYIVTGPMEYKLCAVFATNTLTNQKSYDPSSSHGSGNYCYTFNATR